MPRIEPIPMDQLADGATPHHRGGCGRRDVRHSGPAPDLRLSDGPDHPDRSARHAWGTNSLLGGRILELIRIRSAQLGECQPCMQSRKHDSITDEDVACLVSPGHSDLTDQERLAVEFLDLLSADHHAIDDETYRRLGEVFTAAQIIELGFTCAMSMGTHRFIHTLDPFGTAPPVISFDPDQVDTAYADSGAEPSKA